MKVGTMKQRGGIEIIGLSVVVLLIIGFVGWRITAALQDQADAEDAVASQQSNTSKKKSTSEAADNSTKTKRSLSIVEWGVGGSYEGSTQLKYAINQDNDQFVYMGSDQLTASASGNTLCDVFYRGSTDQAAGGGILRRVKAGTSTSFGAGDSPQLVDEYVKNLSAGDYRKLGEYYYLYQRPQGLCSDDAHVVTQYEATRNDITTFLSSMDQLN